MEAARAAGRVAETAARYEYDGQYFLGFTVQDAHARGSVAARRSSGGQHSGEARRAPPASRGTGAGGL